MKQTTLLPIFPEANFTIIDNDGWNIGLKSAFNETWLEFESFDDAEAIALWWDFWIEGTELCI